MKHLLILIFCCLYFSHAHAQGTYTPAPKAKALHEKAIGLYIKNNKNTDSIVSAIHMMDNVVALDSNFLIAWNNKLSFECQLRQYDNALKTSKRMSVIFPGETDLIFFSGILAFKTGHNEEATAIFEQLIKQYDKIEDDNDDADHLKTTTLNKALAMKMLGRTEESRRVLVNMSVKEHDLTVRRHINAYISKSKEDIINEMIAAR